MDASTTAQNAINLVTFTADQIKAADVNGDGKITALDASLIAQRAINVITSFPVEDK